MMVQLSQSHGGGGSGGVSFVDGAGGRRRAGVGDIRVFFDVWKSANIPKRKDEG